MTPRIQCDWDPEQGVVVLRNPDAIALRAAIAPGMGDNLGEKRFAGEIPGRSALAVTTREAKSGFTLFVTRLSETSENPLKIAFDPELKIDLNESATHAAMVEAHVLERDPTSGDLRSIRREITGAAIAAELTHLDFSEGGHAQALSVARIGSDGRRGPSVADSRLTRPRASIRFFQETISTSEGWRGGARGETRYLWTQLSFAAEDADVARLQQSIACLYAPLAPDGTAEFDEATPLRDVAIPDVSGVDRLTFLIPWGPVGFGDRIGLLGLGDLEFDTPAPVEGAAAPNIAGDVTQIHGPAPARLADGGYVGGRWLGDRLFGDRLLGDRSLDGDAGAGAVSLPRMATEPLKRFTHRPRLDRLARFTGLDASLLGPESAGAAPEVLVAFAEARGILSSLGAHADNLESLAAFTRRPEAAAFLAARADLARRAAEIDPCSGESVAVWTMALIAGGNAAAWTKSAEAEAQARLYALALDSANDELLSWFVSADVTPNTERIDTEASIAAMRRHIALKDPKARRAETDRSVAERTFADLGRENSVLNRSHSIGSALLSDVLSEARDIREAQAAISADLSRVNIALAEAGELPLSDEPELAWRRLGGGSPPSIKAMRSRVLRARAANSTALRMIIERIETRAVLMLLQDRFDQLGQIRDPIERIFELAAQFLREGRRSEFKASGPGYMLGVEQELIEVERAILQDHPEASPVWLLDGDPEADRQRQRSDKFCDKIAVARKSLLDACRQIDDGAAVNWELARRGIELLDKLERLAPWLALRACWREIVGRLRKAEQDAQMPALKANAARLRRRLGHPPRHWPLISIEIAKLISRIHRIEQFQATAARKFSA